MLLPVGAVSAVAASIEKPVVATAETSNLQTTATPQAVLSSTINASVEGKLNMLLVAARDRMFDSLLSAIDAASVALNVSREPGESDAAFAQRVAATIRSLPPPQLAVAQQRLNTQTSTPIPLPLLAEALEEPESPQALQLALSLEPPLAAEPDAVLKAVVNSYGQNAGEAESVVAQTPTLAPTQKATDIAAQAALLTVLAEEEAITPTAAQPIAQPAAQPAQTPQQAPSPSVSASPAPAATVQAAPAQAIAQNGSAPAPAPAPQVAPGANIDADATVLSSQLASQLASLVDDLAAAPLLAAIAAEAKLPIEVELIRSPLAPPPAPRDIQQIQADIKQGLQVIISPPVVASNSDLLQIISNPAASVEKIIAQALTANEAGQMAPQPQPAVDENGRNRLAAAGFMPASLADEPSMAASVTALSGKPQPQTSAGAAMAMFDTAEQLGVPAPVPLGVPFVVANYLPAATPTKEAESKLVDRVKPVDDEESGEARDDEAEQQQSEDDSHAEESSQQAVEEASDDAEAEFVSSEGTVAIPALAALPRPAPVDRPQDHAFDFYRRMVEWE